MFTQAVKPRIRVLKDMTDVSFLFFSLKTATSTHFAPSHMQLIEQFCSYSGEIFVFSWNLKTEKY